MGKEIFRYIFFFQIFFIAHTVQAKPVFLLKGEIDSRDEYCLDQIVDIQNLKESTVSVEEQAIRTRLSSFCSLKSPVGNLFDRKDVEIFLLQAGIFPYRLVGNKVSIKPEALRKNELKENELIREAKKGHWTRLKAGDILSLTYESKCCLVSVRASVHSISGNKVLLRRGKRILSAVRTGERSAKIVFEGKDGIQKN